MVRLRMAGTDPIAKQRKEQKEKFDFLRNITPAGAKTISR